MSSHANQHRSEARLTGTDAPHRFDPLTDVLLRSTAIPAQAGEGSVGTPAGDPPVGSPVASSSRAGVAARSRAAILDGARAAVLANGTKITMSQVAARAGVAKATLYNHYRAREDVLADLLLVEIDSIIAAVEHLSLSTALHRAAVAVSEHPLLEALGAQDSAALSALAMIDVRTAGWARVGQAVDRMLARQGRRGTPTVLRWLSSFLIAPADNADITADVAVLVAGLPPGR